MSYILETARLRLRKFTLDDTGFIVELLNSPGWLQFIGDRNVKTEEQARNYLENGPMKSYRENGYGLAMVERKEDALPIGMCGIINRAYLDRPDIGFAFLPGYACLGYGFEIASATLNHAKNQLNIPGICAITNHDNLKSIRLIEKLGLKYSKKITLPDSKEELLLFDQ